mgnify:CR=1 FL=1
MVQVEIKNRVAYLTLNRPEKRNSLNDEMAQAIHQSLIELKTNFECKVLVVKGNGESFCAGADLSYLQKLQNNSFEENLADSKALKNMFLELYTFPKISIAQVHGAALAGGCGLATLCDFVYSTPGAQFGYTEVKIGFIPAIVSAFLMSKIGENLSNELLLTGKLVDADTALSYRLINGIINENEMNEKIAEMAEKWTQTVSSNSIMMTKKLLYQFKEKTLIENLELACQFNAETRASDDCKKGISAFLNKEKIVW